MWYAGRQRLRIPVQSTFKSFSLSLYWSSLNLLTPFIFIYRILYIINSFFSALVVCTAVYSCELILLKIISPSFKRILPFYRCYFATRRRYKWEVYRVVVIVVATFLHCSELWQWWWWLTSFGSTIIGETWESALSLIAANCRESVTCLNHCDGKIHKRNPGHHLVV